MRIVDKSSLGFAVSVVDMKSFLACILLLTGFSFAAQVETPAPTVTLAVATDRPDANYEVGETVTFQISAKCDGKPVAGPVLCLLSKDGWQPQPTRKVELSADGTATVTVTNRGQNGYRDDVVQQRVPCGSQYYDGYRQRTARC